MTPNEQNVINIAIEWAVVNYLRTDLTESEISLLKEINKLLEEIQHDTTTSN